MIEIDRDSAIDVVSHYGHFSYEMHCEICQESFECHSDISLDEMICPYCKTRFKLLIKYNPGKVSA